MLLEEGDTLLHSLVHVSENIKSIFEATKWADYGHMK
jgi:hypothetical protein